MLDGKKESFWRIHALIFLILLIIHLVFSFAKGDLIALPDELGYWGQARYLAGGLPVNFFNAPYYNFGYALFLVPFFVIFQSIENIYFAAILLNNFLMAAVYFGLYYVVHNIYGAEKRVAITISFAASLYPTFLTQTNFVMAENIFVPVYVLLVIFLYKWLRKDRVIYLFIFSLLSVFLSASHPRAMIIPFLSLLLSGLLCLFRRITKKSFFIALFFISSFYLLAVFMDKHLANVGWTHVNSYNLYKLLPALFSREGMFLFFSTVSGQFLYLFLGTFGLFGLGIYFLFKMVKNQAGLSIRNIFRDNRKIVVLFIMFSSLSILMISWILPIFANINEQLRADHIFYGRYNDGFVIFYLTAGLVALFNQSMKRPFYLLLFFLLAVPVNFVYELLHSINSASTFNIWAVAPTFYLLGQKSIILAAIFAAVVWVVLILSAKYNFKWSLFILFLTFTAFALVNKTMLLDSRQRIYHVSDFAMTQYLKKADHIGQLSFDMSFNAKESPHWATWYLSSYAYQYYLPKIKFQQFYSSSGDRPRSNYVLSRTDWGQAQELKAELIFQDDAIGQALWRLPD